MSILLFQILVRARLYPVQPQQGSSSGLYPGEATSTSLGPSIHLASPLGLSEHWCVLYFGLFVGGFQLENDRPQPVVAATDGHPWFPDPVPVVEELLFRPVGQANTY